MKQKEFDKVADLTFRSGPCRSRSAVQKVVMDGVPQTEAAKDVGISDAAVSQAVRRFKETLNIFNR